MSDFKDKILRKLRSFHVGTIGAIATGLSVIGTLVLLGTYAVNPGDIGESMYELIGSAINCLFYLMLTRNFIEAKRSNKLGLVNQNLLIITIFEYIFPTLGILITNIAFTGIVSGLLGTLISSSIIGILYFVFLARHNKSVGKNNILVLKILGILILLVNVCTGGFYISIAATSTIVDFTNISFVLTFIYYLIDGIAVILFGLVYCLYPFYVSRENRLGY